jgi:hypothetical protein
MNPIQAVTIVSKGGTMMQLSNQRGAPYPTTGHGALVFNTGAHLIDCVFENATVDITEVRVPGGDFYNPSIQFTLDDTNTPGFFSTGPGNISLVGTDGTEISRALLASFDHPGNLEIPKYITAGGTIPPDEDSTVVATTAWVNDTVATAIAGGSAVYVGDTPPSPPGLNQLWWSSALGQMFLWYNDGDTSQWVVVSISSGSVAAPDTGTVVSKITNYTPSLADDGKSFDNNGAVGSVTFTLPAAQIGLSFTFTKVANQPLVIKAQIGVTIYVGELTTSLGGTATASGVGASITLKCRSTTQWFTESFSGTWSIA